MMVLLDGQSGTIVLDPTRDELEEAKTQVSRRHRLELQLEAVVEAAGGHARRPADHAHGQRGPAGGDRGRRAHGRAGRGPAPHRVSAHRPGHASHRRPSRPTTSGGSPRAFRGHTVVIRSYDLGGDKFPVAFKAPVGGQSLPRLAVDPGVPRRARGVPAPDPRRSSARPLGRDIQLMLPLVTAGRGGRGGARRSCWRKARALRRAGVRAARVGAGRRDDRDAGRGADRRPAGRGERVLQRRDQRPDPVHPGRGPRQRPAGRPVHPAPSVGRPAAPPGGAGGPRGRHPGERLRRDGLGAAERRAAARPGLRPPERVAAGAAAGQVGGADRARRPPAARAAESALAAASADDVSESLRERGRGVHRRAAARPALGVAWPRAGGYLATRQDAS